MQSRITEGWGWWCSWWSMLVNESFNSGISVMQFGINKYAFRLDARYYVDSVSYIIQILKSLFNISFTFNLHQARSVSQVTSPFSWAHTQPLTLLCLPSPVSPLVVLPPLSAGGEMAYFSVMTTHTVSHLEYWQMPKQPPSNTHWRWLVNCWDSISAVCLIEEHFQEVPRA